MAFNILIVSVIIVIGSVHMSPVSVRTKGSDRNEIKNLFFMTEQEEKCLEEDTVYNSVIEKVKARILNGLHLKEPPRPVQSVPPLLHFIPQNSSWSGLFKNRTASKTNGNGMNDIFQSEIVPNTCFDQKDVHCVRFQIGLRGMKMTGKTAEIWLYKKEGIRQFTLTKLTKDGLKKEHFNVSNLSKSAKWIRLDGTILLDDSDLLDLEVSSFDLAIHTGKDKNPIIIIKNTAQSRNKRSLRLCGSGMTHCCVKNFHIEFKDIGWDSWIIEPAGYEANICKGSCENRMDLTHNHHSTIMITMLSKSKKTAAEIRESIHCSPKQYLPLSIIYIDEAGLKVITNLPNMTVTDCACR